MSQEPTGTEASRGYRSGYPSVCRNSWQITPEQSASVESSSRSVFSML